MPNAHWNKQKHQSLEQRFIIGPRKEHSLSKAPNSLNGFLGRLFKDNIWGEGCRVRDFLLIGWWWGNRNLLLSLKLSSSAWVRALAPREQLKDMYQIAIHWGETRTLFYHKIIVSWNFPGGLVVTNLPSNAEDAGLIPGPGRKISHAMGQLSPHTNLIWNCILLKKTKQNKKNTKNCYLTMPFLFLHPLPFLISNFLGLLFGTWGGWSLFVQTGSRGCRNKKGIVK